MKKNIFKKIGLGLMAIGLIIGLAQAEALANTSPTLAEFEEMRLALVERYQAVGRDPVFSATLTALPDSQWLQVFQDKITEIIPFYVNHLDNGGDWQAKEVIPNWTETTLLSAIGDPARLTVPLSADAQETPAWYEQQRNILDMLQWTILTPDCERKTKNAYPNANGKNYSEVLQVLTNAWGSATWSDLFPATIDIPRAMAYYIHSRINYDPVNDLYVPGAVRYAGRFIANNICTDIAHAAVIYVKAVNYATPGANGMSVIDSIFDPQGTNLQENQFVKFQEFPSSVSAQHTSGWLGEIDSMPSLAPDLPIPASAPEWCLFKVYRGYKISDVKTVLKWEFHDLPQQEPVLIVIEPQPEITIGDYPAGQNPEDIGLIQLRRDQNYPEVTHIKLTALKWKGDPDKTVEANEIDKEYTGDVLLRDKSNTVKEIKQVVYKDLPLLKSFSAGELSLSLCSWIKVAYNENLFGLVSFKSDDRRIKDIYIKADPNTYQEKTNCSVEIKIPQFVDYRHFSYDEGSRIISLVKNPSPAPDGTPDLFQWMAYDVIKDPNNTDTENKVFSYVKNVRLGSREDMKNHENASAVVFLTRRDEFNIVNLNLRDDILMSYWRRNLADFSMYTYLSFPHHVTYTFAHEFHHAFENSVIWGIPSTEATMGVRPGENKDFDKDGFVSRNFLGVLKFLEDSVLMGRRGDTIPESKLQELYFTKDIPVSDFLNIGTKEFDIEDKGITFINEYPKNNLYLSGDIKVLAIRRFGNGTYEEVKDPNAIGINKTSQTREKIVFRFTPRFDLINSPAEINGIRCEIAVDCLLVPGEYDADYFAYSRAQRLGY